MDKKEQLKMNNLELYNIAMENGTEAPFSGDLLHNEESGTYKCAVCGAELFDSSAKFDSGSGWPSFTNPTNKKYVTLIDDDTHVMRRTEVRCASCDAHLGHVFPDGPSKEGILQSDRFCINSISLDFDQK